MNICAVYFEPFIEGHFISREENFSSIIDCLCTSRHAIYLQGKCYLMPSNIHIWFLLLFWDFLFRCGDYRRKSLTKYRLLLVWLQSNENQITGRNVWMTIDTWLQITDELIHGSRTKKYYWSTAHTCNEYAHKIDGTNKWANRWWFYGAS